MALFNECSMKNVYRIFCRQCLVFSNAVVCLIVMFVRHSMGSAIDIGKPLRYSNIVYDVVMERSWIFQSIRIKLNREH